MIRSNYYRRLNPTGGTGREVSEVVNNILDGKTNNSGYMTSLAGTTETIIYNERIGFDSAIIFTPMDDKAAIEMAKLWVGTRLKGSATINHGSNGHDCLFMYIIVA